MSREVMERALASLVEVLGTAGADLRGVNNECCMQVSQSSCFDAVPECCGCPMDAEDRAKLAIDALQKALGLQGAAA